MYGNRTSVVHIVLCAFYWVTVLSWTCVSCCQVVDGLSHNENAETFTVIHTLINSSKRCWKEGDLHTFTEFPYSSFRTMTPVAITGSLTCPASHARHGEAGIKPWNKEESVKAARSSLIDLWCIACWLQLTLTVVPSEAFLAFTLEVITSVRDAVSSMMTRTGVTDVFSWIQIKGYSLIIRSFVRSFIRSFVGWLVGWFIGSFIHSFVRSFVHLFVRSFVHSFVRLFVYSFVRSFVHSFIRSFIRSFIHSFIRSFVRSFVHSFIHSVSQSFNQSINQSINQPTNQQFIHSFI